MRHKRRRRAKNEWMATCIIAFGLGLFLALFCSMRLVLLAAVIALIYVGIKSRC